MDKNIQEIIECLKSHAQNIKQSSQLIVKNSTDNYDRHMASGIQALSNDSLGLLDALGVLLSENQ